MEEMSLSESFTRTILDVHGETGRDWLRRLPATLDSFARRWSLQLLPPFEALSYNYVAPAVQSGERPVVLKIGVPDDGICREIEALRLYDGEGTVRLLEADPDRGALLLERVQPGTPLSHLNDDARTTAIAAEVMGRMWRPVPAVHPFPSVADWAKGLNRLRDQFDGGTGPFPAVLVDQAEHLFADLLASMADPVLLHGDLHHDNILAGERAPWLALDPKGVIGEPAYEVGALLRNPFDRLATEPNLDRLMARRVDQLSEALGLDRTRLMGWGMAQAVLSGWWNYEDHGRGWEFATYLAKCMARLLR